MAWTIVGDMREIGLGEAKSFELEGRKIAVFNLDGRFYALEDACPHRGGPLSEGSVSDGAVSCPWHSARFDIKSGQHLSPPASRGVPSFPVKVEGSMIQVDLP